MIACWLAKGALALSLAIGAFTAQAQGQAPAQDNACPAEPVDDPAFKQAAEALTNDEFQRALRLTDAVGDARLADVIRIRAYGDDATQVGFSDIRDLINRRPTWPLLGTLRLRGEKLLPSNLSPTEKAAWYDQAAPETFDGLTDHLDALRQLGRTDDRAHQAVNYWHRYPMRSDQQAQFLRTNGEFLTVEDHWRRADRMVWSSDFDQAERILPLLSGGQQAVIEARIRLRRGASGVDAAIRRVPQAFQNDEGLLYDRLRWRQRRDLVTGALEILSRQPTEVDNPRSWWRARMIMAREALNAGQPVDAYAISASHRETAGVRLVEAEWLAGWVALYHLQRPGQAAEHFAAILNASKTPISRSRGAYWLGEAWRAMGDREKAIRWWETAAQYPTAFYGQLAAEKLGRLVPFPPTETAPVAPSAGALLGEMGCLVLTLGRLGAADLADPFMARLARNADTADELRAVAGLSLAVGNLPSAVAAGKKLMTRGHFLPSANYPDLPVPREISVVEPSITTAIIRQESVFDRHAVSRAGARGLMQLMPATADETAKRLGFSVSRADLTERPDINVRLGSSYFQGLMSRYDGATVLAVAAYNAGPGNVNRWIRRYGDPRDPSVDARHWIESIPFSETRNYVQRVLENTIVYRRLNGEVGTETDLLSLLTER